MQKIRHQVKKQYADLHTSDPSSSTEISVSYDGSWLTRGHTSKYGVGCIIYVLTGYVLDYAVLSKYCKSCTYAVRDLDENSPEFSIWMEGHKDFCQKNHTASSNAMETFAAAQIWQR